jgi:hypothetical protein
MSGRGKGGRKDKRKIENTSPDKVAIETTPKSRRTSISKSNMASKSTGEIEGNPGGASDIPPPGEPNIVMDLDDTVTNDTDPEKTKWFGALRDCIMVGITKKIDEQDEKMEKRMTSNAKSVSTTMATMHADIKVQFTKYDSEQKKQTERADKLDTKVTSIETQLTTQTATVTSLSEQFKTMQKTVEADIAKLRTQLAKGPPPQQGAWSSRPPLSTPTEFELSVQIAGLQEEQDENLLEIVCTRVFSLMGLYYGSDQIVECNRVGRERSPTEEATGTKIRPRPVYVKFYLTSTKDKVMRQRFKLRKKGIYVNDSYPIHIERSRQRLRPIVQKANRMLEYDGRIELKDDKIILDGNAIGVDELHKIPNNIHPRDICTEKRGDVTFFFRQDSPLSNHHSCLINVAGKTYNCVEQAY